METLWARADGVRERHVGDEVHLRGLVEISNHCVRKCGYCGISLHNRDVPRYRMEAGEILECARRAAELEFGTVVLQAGEDYGLTREFVTQIVRRIRAETPLAVTLSLGERPEEDLESWREAGADRYLLRFETSDPVLYERIHPSLPGRKSDRFALLARLREMGYEIGSGVMVGIPGQSYDSLAQDILRFAQLDLDMIGVGPFIPHPDTPLGDLCSPEIERDQVPATEDMTYRVLALARLACPEANIPSTTALATLNRETGRELGLARGANVIMPNLTPAPYRALYEIYPDKACIHETASECASGLRRRIESMGRTIASGPGGRKVGG
jgi:biotin synthase